MSNTLVTIVSKKELRKLVEDLGARAEWITITESGQSYETIQVFNDVIQQSVAVITIEQATAMINFGVLNDE